MKSNPIKFNHDTEELIINRTFAKKAYIYGTEEYKLLQKARKDFPNYGIATRAGIKKNPQKEAFKGLDYDFMEQYFKYKNAPAEIWEKYEHMRLMAGCHSRRFPIVKKWFLELYPEVKNWGKVKEEVPAADSAVGA